ncbi:hypothetical protein BDQ17DRAFT_1262393, partial [Cyathus striatus]
SFCLSLCEGFWPFAVHKSDYPLTYDCSKNQPSLTPEQENFLYAQCDKEVALGHFSPVLKPTFKQGTYSMPVHAIPKAEAGKYHMITNHSSGKCALNNLVSCEVIAGCSPLDSLKPLADSMLALQKKYSP